jgi:hypothetical protein
VSAFFICIVPLCYTVMADPFCQGETAGVPRTPLLLNYPCTSTPAVKVAYLMARVPATLWDQMAPLGVLHNWPAYTLLVAAVRLLLSLLLPLVHFKVSQGPGQLLALPPKA